jgi:hypothetical protein
MLLHWFKDINFIMSKMNNCGFKGLSDIKSAHGAGRREGSQTSVPQYFLGEKIKIEER